MCHVLQQYMFALGFVFSVCVLNCEFELQITMRTMGTWHDMENNSSTFTLTHVEMY